MRRQAERTKSIKCLSQFIPLLREHFSGTPALSHRCLSRTLVEHVVHGKLGTVTTLNLDGPSPKCTTVYVPKCVVI